MAIALLPLLALAACTSRPPPFSVEPREAVASQPDVESLSIGSPSTPPPGEYRFARLYADGTVEARELFTSNGPGPWLSYAGRVRVPAALVRDAMPSVREPSSPAEDRRGPCVLAVASAQAKWEGCAYPEIAAGLLAVVPRLAMPDVDSACDLPACQIRIVRGAAPVRHEQYAEVHQDRMLNHDGAFWCAASAGRTEGRIATLRVARGRISEPDGPRVFTWIAAGIEIVRADAQSLPDPAADSVMVRDRSANWNRLTRTSALRVRERWNLIVSKFPEECQSPR